MLFFTYILLFLLMNYSFSISFNSFEVLQKTKIGTFKRLFLHSENEVEFYEKKFGVENIIRTYLVSKKYENYMNEKSSEDSLYPTSLPFKHFQLNEMKNIVKNISNYYPYCKYHVAGKTIIDRELFFIEIDTTSEIELKEEEKNNVITKPGIEFIANIHGDEIVGPILMVHLIAYLCENYKSDDRVKKLLDNTRIFIMPTMNPDGYVNVRRGNSNGVDINRNFPDHFKKSTAPLQKETEIMMKFPEGKDIVLGAHFHGGAEVVSYPWDGVSSGRIVYGGEYSATPDDNLYKFISTTYANLNYDMKHSDEFDGGITNGAYWYTLYGGIQDWHYINHGIIDLTVELSNMKKCSPAHFVHHWNVNFESFFAYMEFAYKLGVKGKVYDISTNKTIDKANIEIDKIEKTYFSFSDGSYYRLLTPGTYTVKCSLNGYSSVSKEITIPENQEKQIVVDFYLEINEYSSKWENTLLGVSLLLIFVCLFLLFSVVILVFVIWMNYKRRKGKGDQLTLIDDVEEDLFTEKIELNEEENKDEENPYLQINSILDDNPIVTTEMNMNKE